MSRGLAGALAAARLPGGTRRRPALPAARGVRGRASDRERDRLLPELRRPRDGAGARGFRRRARCSRRPCRSSTRRTTGSVFPAGLDGALLRAHLRQQGLPASSPASKAPRAPARARSRRPRAARSRSSATRAPAPRADAQDPRPEAPPVRARRAHPRLPPRAAERRAARGDRSRSTCPAARRSSGSPPSSAPWPRRAPSGSWSRRRGLLRVRRRLRLHSPRAQRVRARRGLRAALPAGCERGYSTSRTCEIGLSLHAGIPYQFARLPRRPAARAPGRAAPRARRGRPRRDG